MKTVIALIMTMIMAGCVSIETGDTVTDSYNEASPQDVIDGEVQPNEDGTCPKGYFYCSIEKACLHTDKNGGICPLGHTDVEEAEADEANDNNNTGA